MRTEGMRQSDRVSLHLAVEGSWLNAGGETVTLQLRTLLVSRNGGVVFSESPLSAGQDLTLKRTTKSEVLKTARARVLAEIDKDKDGFLYAIHILEPKVDFWEIDFPAPYLGEQALGRMLMECSFCQKREVVYLNEMELKSFEVRKCVARHCKSCDAPSIWVEAVGEGPAAADASVPDVTGKTERITPSRNRTRVKARLLACIRRRGFQEEVAVCEDLSRGGLSFRSRNEYPQGTRLDVAVPFTPGSGNIFVPIRIVSSHKIQAAGLYRHGAAYIRQPLET
ncbi:MAG: PilZ domain-containing protein [Candidatus Acidiferrales bacterium]